MEFACLYLLSKFSIDFTYHTCVFMSVHTLSYQLPNSGLHSLSPRPPELGEVVSHDNFYREHSNTMALLYKTLNINEPGMLVVGCVCG